MLSVLSAWASLWLLISVPLMKKWGSDHCKSMWATRSLFRYHELLLLNSKLILLIWAAQWKSLWTNSVATNVCEGVNCSLKTALPGRLLVFSQDLKAIGSGCCFLWEHAEVPHLEKMKLCLCSQQNEVPNGASCVVMLVRAEDNLQPQDFLG